MPLGVLSHSWKLGELGAGVVAIAMPSACHLALFIATIHSNSPTACFNTQTQVPTKPTVSHSLRTPGLNSALSSVSSALELQGAKV